MSEETLIIETGTISRWRPGAPRLVVAPNQAIVVRGNGRAVVLRTGQRLTFGERIQIGEAAFARIDLQERSFDIDETTIDSSEAPAAIVIRGTIHCKVRTDRTGHPVGAAGIFDRGNVEVTKIIAGSAVAHIASATGRFSLRDLGLARATLEREILATHIDDDFEISKAILRVGLASHVAEQEIKKNDARNQRDLIIERNRFFQPFLQENGWIRSKLGAAKDAEDLARIADDVKVELEQRVSTEAARIWDEAGKGLLTTAQVREQLDALRRNSPTVTGHLAQPDSPSVEKDEDEDWADAAPPKRRRAKRGRQNEEEEAE